MKRLLLPALAALSLAACSTPTVYQAATGPNAMGYSEYRIEPGRYRVFFRGGSGASPEQVTDFALVRAADLALSQGYDWFRVGDRNVQAVGGGYGPQIGLGVGGASFGRNTATSVGVGTGFNLGGGPELRASMEVLMGRGPLPPGLDVYDARAVRGSLGPPASPLGQQPPPLGQQHSPLGQQPPPPPPAPSGGPA
jgi:hypothetical protein